MEYVDIVFYFFSILTILSGIAVILARNPVHSVLYLVLVFVMSSGLVFLLLAEFIAVILIVVYVGAIAVLFLFVVMMLNIRLVELDDTLVRYIPLGIIVGVSFYIELFYILKKDLVNKEGNIEGIEITKWIDYINGGTNLEILGELLYTYYVYYFIIGGLILLVAMIGTIVLTLYHEVGIKRQEIYKQVGRRVVETIVKKEIN